MTGPSENEHDVHVDWMHIGPRTEEMAGELLEVPGMTRWLILCRTHGFYVPVTVDDGTREKVTESGMQGPFLESLWGNAQAMFTEEGCGGTVPRIHWDDQ